MAKELLEIQPLELKFTFEVKKQSSCIIQLGNKSDQYVAFKVKTTSPKKYCVRPNVGIIKPKATFDFTVTMQAQRVAPPDLQCKDKFLIQSTVVPFEIADEDITSNMFAKDNGKYIEEKKLRVVLVSPTQSPVLLTRNGELKQESPETSLQKDRAFSGVENIPPCNSVAADLEALETAKVADELTEANNVQRLETAETTNMLAEAKDVQRFEGVKVINELAEAKDMQKFETSKHTDELKAARDLQSMPVEDAEEMKPAKSILELKLARDFEELKLKLNVTDSQLKEAGHTIAKLKEEKSLATREKDMLKHELEVLTRKTNVRKVQIGFPLLYVCMVALISLVAGYLTHPQSRSSL
ncbi:Vesicle-associated protein 2-2-like [Melia azedarach]|nr:Vesicle-associated protein 2-2-like [Melia azedarach]